MDRQLKEWFIHGLNDSDMIMEKIKEFIKMEKNENMTSEQVLACARKSRGTKSTIS